MHQSLDERGAGEVLHTDPKAARWQIVRLECQGACRRLGIPSVAMFVFADVEIELRDSGGASIYEQREGLMTPRDGGPHLDRCPVCLGEVATTVTVDASGPGSLDVAPGSGAGPPTP